MTIPSAYGPLFLEWLRARTERAWAGFRSPELADFERAGVGGAAWRRGTRWSGGLNAQGIAAIEREFGVRFPPDHRLFLELLHSTTPRRFGAAFVDGARLAPVERAGFYDWTAEGADIRAAREGVVDGLVFDVEHNGLWPDSWGARPSDERERHERVGELVAGAPALLPIFGHRFVLAEGPTVVLSVHQSDIIVYGGDLRGYLLTELGDLLGLSRFDVAPTIDLAGVPFWGELVT